MKTSVLCHGICIFLLIVSITVAGCISNENSPAASTSSTPTIQPTSTSTPIPMNTPAANSTPFITIDPIGNHSIGDVFFINGTTNLPVTENLTVQIIEGFHLRTKADLGAYVHGITEDVPISPNTTTNMGVHQWSLNVTDPVMIALVSDRYSVGVYSKDANISSDLDYFYLYPAVVVNSTPFITIDPIGNHSIGDVFFINGTTNLPVSDSLIIFVSSVGNPPGGYGSSFQSTIPITPGENGINFWSCDVNTTAGWLSFHGPHSPITQIAEPGGYGAFVELSTDSNISQYSAPEPNLLFNINEPATNANATLLG